MVPEIEVGIATCKEKVLPSVLYATHLCILFTFLANVLRRIPEDESRLFQSQSCSSTIVNIAEVSLSKK